MSAKKERVATMDIERIQEIVGNKWMFDLSRIRAEDYESLLCGLIRHAEEVDTMVISCDHYCLVSNLGTIDRLNAKRALEINDVEFLNSAYSKNKLVFQTMILALKHFLPRAKNLVRLEFRNLALNYLQVEALSKTLDKCTSLKHLIFYHVSLLDDGVAMILKEIRATPLVYLCLISCGLSDASASAIKGYLVANAGSMKRGQRGCKFACLQSLDLRENSFSYRLLLELGDVLSVIPLKVIDVRKNQMIDNEIAVNMKQTIRGVDVRVNNKKCKKFVPALPKADGEAPDEYTWDDISFVERRDSARRRKRRARNAARSRLWP